jgi:hypothetical protein
MLEELPPDGSYLESLTTAELLKLADRAGIDLPPGLDRTIVIEELLETGDAQSLGSPPEETESLDKSPLPLMEKQQAATAPLPKQYNISYIEVLIRDPLWAFAFWEINAHDKETLEAAPDFGGYCLRVMPVPEPETGSVSGSREPKSPSFTVPVGTGDSAWYLNFPPEEGHFKVELCVMRKDEPVILAVSKPFRLPKLPEAVEGQGANPLLRLSGIDDFTILRNTLRSSRLPKRNYARTGVTAAGPQE